MTDVSAQTLREIKQLPVLTVFGKMDECHTATNLLHPDSFVADRRITLRSLFSSYRARIGLLGRRIADMGAKGRYFPLGLDYVYATETVRIFPAGDEGNAHDLDPNDCAPTWNLGFAIAKVVDVPDPGDERFFSHDVGSFASFLVALDGPVYVRANPADQAEVIVDPNSAAIIPPSSSIFMQGARGMLVRPILA